MPELPEVETVARGLRETILGCRFNQIVAYRRDLRREVRAEEIQECLHDQLIERVSRRAKYLILTTKTHSLALHFGMSGYLLTPIPEFTRPKHLHFEFIFKDIGARVTKIGFVDPRRFSAIELIRNDQIETHPLLKDLGPEPLEDDPLELARRIQKSFKCKRPVKSVLMDSSVIVGVGNIYASESLFGAGVSPLVHAEKLNFDQIIMLCREIQLTLSSAIQSQGTTLRDFRTVYGEQGNNASNLRVYGRENQPCTRCSSSIEMVRLGGRSTYFCPSCQIS